MQKRQGTNVNNISNLPILPDGKDDTRYLNENEEWPNLVNRLGEPRILNHQFYSETMEWIKQKNNPDLFSFLDAGCGHGNDLRALRTELGGRGNFFGVDISKAEIMHGLDFYREQEEFEEAVKMFGLGSLNNPQSIRVWDNREQDFSKQGIITNEAVDLIHMEAVLQAAGYGEKVYAEKKEKAFQVLRELARVCKKGGKFLGRVSAFSAEISREKQFEILQSNNCWHFVPGTDEFVMMLRLVGFDKIQRVFRPHEDAATDSSKRGRIKISFLAEKI